VRISFQLILLAVVPLVVTACEKKPTYAEQLEIEKAQTLQKVEDFHNRQDTNSEWFRVMDSGEAFTVEIQQALLSDDSPRLIIADLLDIARSGQKLVATFGETWMESDPLFRLEVTPAQAEEIQKTIPMEDRGSARFAVAFRPESLIRPIIKIDAEGYDENAEVELQSSRAIIITGGCVAWQYLGPSGIDMSDFIKSQSK
jgi:hypothetical protein